MKPTFLYKQAIVFREDLKLSPGKMAVQAAHASVGVILKSDILTYVLSNWLKEGFRKIVLKVKTEQDIFDLEQKCILNNIPYFVVRDFGLTEIEPDTVTCIGIGPDTNEKINKITGSLGLWR